MTATLPLSLFGRTVRALHLVGIGGTGMTPLALCLAQAGYIVTGEDDSLTPAVKELLELGAVTVTGAGSVPPPPTSWFIRQLFIPSMSLGKAPLPVGCLNIVEENFSRSFCCAKS